MTDPYSVESYKPEGRMLIDGELVWASNGKTFDNINPANEEVLGVVADGTKEDMQVAIAAARRAFDETDWSTNHERELYLEPNLIFLLFPQPLLRKI